LHFVLWEWDLLCGMDIEFILDKSRLYSLSQYQSCNIFNLVTIFTSEISQ
jgi:hypothetical protein